jgi:hypothetical protein
VEEEKRKVARTLEEDVEFFSTLSTPACHLPVLLCVTVAGPRRLTFSYICEQLLFHTALPGLPSPCFFVMVLISIPVTLKHGETDTSFLLPLPGHSNKEIL